MPQSARFPLVQSPTNGDHEMTDMPTPMVTPGERQYTQLRQVIVRGDDEITAVNQLLADGWRILHIGQRPDATVFVLGRMEEKQKHRTGFLTTD
jgi:hypothetical protein